MKNHAPVPLNGEPRLVSITHERRNFDQDQGILLKFAKGTWGGPQISHGFGVSTIDGAMPYSSVRSILLELVNRFDEIFGFNPTEATPALFPIDPPPKESQEAYPTEPGFYWARTGRCNRYHCIAEVAGESPMLYVSSLFDFKGMPSRVTENPRPIDIIFGPKIEHPLPPSQKPLEVDKEEFRKL